jgi:hypothetical protein
MPLGLNRYEVFLKKRKKEILRIMLADTVFYFVGTDIDICN